MRLLGVGSLERVRAPFGYHLPPGLAVLLALAGAGLLTLPYRRLVGRHLLQPPDDHRYEHAARMVTQQPTPPWTVDQAVDYLVTLGERRGWARFNLRLLRKHAMKSHNLEKKSAKRKRAFGQDHPVAKADDREVRKLLGLPRAKG